MPLAKKLKKIHTYRDYLNWDPDVRVEIIDGVVYDMTPAPVRKHQEILMSLALSFGNFLKNKKCRVYPAPFDVRLPSGGEGPDDSSTVVQPDISVICDHGKLDEKGCVGAPDLVVEILSPATAAKDMREKLSLFERHGVREYWIIQPTEETLMVFIPGGDGKYSKPQVYSKQDTVSVKILRGLRIRLAEVFTS
ncbi:MAG: Uma2 family endonuclease [Spirochaetes bacterium]|nr:Uma2 family endonuclease [Spirochaetota bacterium]